MGEEDFASESDVVDPAASRATGRSPAFDLAHQLWLCTWKNLKLRGNRPVATILEIVCPLVAFVALTVLAPRNDYFDAPYAPFTREAAVHSKCFELAMERITAAIDDLLEEPYKMAGTDADARPRADRLI